MTPVETVAQALYEAVREGGRHLPDRSLLSWSELDIWFASRRYRDPWLKLAQAVIDLCAETHRAGRNLSLPQVTPFVVAQVIEANLVCGLTAIQTRQPEVSAYTGGL